jgi:Ni/Co efflux regulator RcnB
MKALVTAFALLSFVAATTIPYVASAATQTEQTTPKKAKKTSTKKHVKKASTHKKTTKKAPKKTQPAA